MLRRNFIKDTALSGLTLVAGSILSKKLSSPKYKMGYQLYSIRDEMAVDPISTLGVLKAMGYNDFEAYGYDEDRDMFYGHSSTEFKSIIDDMGLSVTSGHYGFAPYLNEPNDKLRRFVDKCIIGAKTINSKYITWPWIAAEQRTLGNFKRLPEKLNLIGEQVNQAGLGFAYHNHGFEFEDHNGITGYDIIANETDSELVKFQMDMYWVMHSSSTTPKELVAKYPGRYVMWHIKDMDKLTRDYTELGNGSIDYKDILPDPKQSGLEYYYIEQGGNFTHNSIQSAADSAAYLKANLRKKL